MDFIKFVIEKYKVISIVLIIISIGWALVGKHKWHYFPLYILVFLYFALLMLNYFDILILSPKSSKWIIAVALLLIIAFVFFIFGFPTEKIPIPSGNYQIGTKTYDLIDNSRKEIYSENENDVRKIKYQVWYPTNETEGYKKSKWVSDGTLVTRELAKSMFVPFFMLDHTAEIYSNSYINAPISNDLDHYPVVLISHGWKGFRELHTDFAEELASNGFIAISIDHTYGSQAVKFKDGSVATINKDALPSFVKPATFNKASAKLTTTYGKDIVAVLDELETLNNSEDFMSKLNLDEIGLLGHSTGGGAGVYTSQQDGRVKALMGLDAWVNPLKSNGLNQGLNMPTLFLRSEKWSEGPNNKGLNALTTNSDNANLIQIDKTKHVDFSMAYMYSPLTKYIGMTGKLGKRKSSAIQRDFILNFFEKNLKDNKSLDDNYIKNIIDKYEAVHLIR